MKSINLLTVKNLKLNKSRTIVTILGIMLSCALITVVMNVAFSFQKTLLEEEIITSGNYIYSSNYASTEFIEKIRANRDVEDVYVEKLVGFGKLDAPKFEDRDGVAVKALSDTAFTKGFRVELEEGRFPQNNHELVLANNMVKNSRKVYHVGDTITLKLGNRINTEAGCESRLDAYCYMGNGEYELRDLKEYTYNIVGILKENYSETIEVSNGYDFCNAITLYQGEEISEADSDVCFVYANYKESEMARYKEISGDITGVSAGCFEARDLTDAQREEWNQHVKKDQIIEINRKLITRRGIDLSDDATRFISIIACVVMVIIVFVSIFVIRNSFAISITEKTKLYGMLASLGATAKQVRDNVLFEGAILGVVGIPLGLGLGYVVTGGLIAVINMLLGEFMAGMVIQFGTSIWAVIVAVGLSMITIFFSSIFTAIRASKISPIVAIRNNLEVNTNAKKEKNFRKSKWTFKFFGMGGEIAKRSLKRSKKKYRTTVISIVVSVILFLSMAAFMEYSFDFLMTNIDERQEKTNITVFSPEGESLEKLQKRFHQYQKMGDVKESFADYMSYIRVMPNSNLNLCEEGEYFYLLALEKEQFVAMAEKAGMTYEEAKGKVFYYQPKKKDGKDTQVSFAPNTKVTCYGLIHGEGEDLPEKELKSTLIVAQTVNEKPEDVLYGVDECFFVEAEVVKESKTMSASMQFLVDNPDQFEENILELGTEDTVQNMDKTMRMLRALRFVIAIFVYGFIIVVTLIGITNIFNTITTNMKLRQKEFAMLRSVGMTYKEFQRMIRLESLMYGMKALLIGLPLGLLGNYSIYYAFSRYNEEMAEASVSYVFPWVETAGCILCVLALIRIIMTFSVAKTKEQNIIETIRNDNI